MRPQSLRRRAWDRYLLIAGRNISRDRRLPNDAVARQVPLGSLDREHDFPDVR